MPAKLHIALHDAAGDVAYERSIAAGFSMRYGAVELNIPSLDDNNEHLDHQAVPGASSRSLDQYAQVVLCRYAPLRNQQAPTSELLFPHNSLWLGMFCFPKYHVYHHLVLTRTSSHH